MGDALEACPQRYCYHAWRPIPERRELLQICWKTVAEIDPSQSVAVAVVFLLPVGSRGNEHRSGTPPAGVLWLLGEGGVNPSCEGLHPCDRQAW